MEPRAPKEADSVGVAIPNKIEPKTKKIRVIGGRIILDKSIKLMFIFLLL